MKYKRAILTAIAAVVLVALLIIVHLGVITDALEVHKEPESKAAGTNESAVPTVTSAPAIPPDVPDNSELQYRLESAGASYELREALNNPIPEAAEEELNSLLDKYFNAPEQSSERQNYLLQINEYVIPGANEGLPGEIQKEEALDLAAVIVKSLFDADISNSVDDIRIRYFLEGYYSLDDVKSCWEISGSTDTEWYSIVFDAKTGEIVRYMLEYR